VELIVEVAATTVRSSRRMPIRRGLQSAGQPTAGSSIGVACSTVVSGGRACLGYRG
jgi:hypothetical protein